MATPPKTYLPLEIVAYQGQHELVQSAFETAGLEHLMDRAMYWLFLLAPRTTDHWKEDVGIPVPVNAKLSRRLLAIDREDAVMVDTLLDAGIIETDGSYRPGAESRKFRINPEITRRPNECYEITGQLADTLRKAAAKIRAEQYRDMLDGLKCPRLVFDHQIRMLRDLKISPQARIDLDADAADAERQCCTIDYSYWFALDSLERMASMDDSELLTECDYSRLHSPVSRAWSGFRRYMTLGGEPLASCDIKTSQPYFLSVLFEKLADMLDQAQGNDHLVESLTAYLDMLVAPMDVHVALMGYMMKRFTDRGFGNLRHDLGVFGELAKNGDLYQHLMKLSGFEGKRPDFKKTFFQAFYGEPRIARHLPTWKRFQETFPDLAREIDLAKAKDYTVLPRLMQMIEGRAMFHHVAPRLMERGIIFFTLHDAIYAPCSEITEVKTIMKEVLASCGLHPTLAVEEKQEKREPKPLPVSPITSSTPRRTTRRKT